MRSTVAEMERSSGKKGAVPITVRQLEAIIRIAGRLYSLNAIQLTLLWNLIFILESLAKMRMSAFATGRDVDEALRLFKGSTMAAASTGALSGVEGEFFQSK